LFCQIWVSKSLQLVNQSYEDIIYDDPKVENVLVLNPQQKKTPKTHKWKEYVPRFYRMKKCKGKKIQNKLPFLFFEATETVRK